MCLPPSHLDEDNWTLEGASSCRYPPNTIETVLKFGIYSSPVKDGNPLLRSGVGVHDLGDAGPNTFLPLVANATRGARHSYNIWKEPQNLDACMQFSFFILVTAGCFCALFRWIRCSTRHVIAGHLDARGFKGGDCGVDRHSPGEGRRLARLHIVLFLFIFPPFLLATLHTFLPFFLFSDRRSWGDFVCSCDRVFSTNSDK
jgi:hypothetical protein